MQEKSDRRSNATRTQEMRERLIASARELFSQKGFADTGTPEIVRHAAVTRGALYHHFADKTDLFRAVAEAEAEAVEHEITTSADATETPDAAMRAGTLAFFASMSKEGRARILLIDGPAVLGHEEMDRINAGNGRASLVDGLQSFLPDRPSADIEALALTLSAGFDRAALAVAEGGDPTLYSNILIELIEGLAR